MAAICTSTVSPTGCNHRVLTITLDGTPYVIAAHEGDLTAPLTAEEARQLIALGLRRLRQSGVTLAQLLNRVCVGDEATNVKQHDIIGAGVAITKTNIGTAYVNVLPGANGERALIDFTGCVEFRIILTANLVGAGQWGARLIRDSDNAVLFEAVDLGAAGEREMDTNWQSLPPGFNNLTLVRLQAKSQTAGDDPVFRRCVVLVR